MCKYCDDVKLREKLLNTGIDRDGVYLGCSKSIIPESDRFECCPKCGAPLGEVKPLTVEQLIEKIGQDVLIRVPSTKESGMKKIELSYHFCRKCIEAFGYYLYLDELGTTWIAYTQEPKGETE